MIRLKLITLHGVHFDDEVHEAVIPTKAGDIAIYGGHAPLLSVAAPGLVAIRKEKSVKDIDREFVAIYGGTVEVLNNEIQVLVDEVDTSDDISEAEAEKALKRAQELRGKASDAHSLAEAQQMIDRSTVRLQLAGLKKRHKQKY
ncbi:MAG TPA: ATP synthase F1 subunit epsilon [Candidatus Saccharimonadales bacterium]|nr:ATP synthase F1 subunit epsilon [Candidatus Saccharimonadales bacterium]